MRTRGFALGCDAVRVEIRKYDDAWPKIFSRAREELTSIVGRRAVIEHVGSTSVPGLVAKPIIDILIGVNTLDPAYAESFVDVGYTYVPEHEATMPFRRFFKRYTKGSSVHVHMVVRTDPFFRDHIAFRDWLRAHPEDARAYGDLKLHLASRLDRDAYQEQKGPFIRAMTLRAVTVSEVD